MSGYEFILYNVEDGIAELVLNRPEKLNAFHLPMYEEICSALASAEQDDAVRVILLRGNGRAFSAGRDFSYSSEIQQEERDAWRRRYRLFTRWTLLNNKMIVALVQGYALGGGGSLAVGSDITLAAAGTKFGYPETRHGPAGKTMIWSWAYGPKVAKETVASGRMITVEEVAHLGLVNRVVAADELLEEGWSLARDIAAMPAGLPQIVKRTVNYATRDMVRTIYDDRKFDVDSAHWDAAGVVPSPWMMSTNDAFHEHLRSRIRPSESEDIRR
jgi:enoyl-CoA hydratase/carnithine racemase